jgi:twitching motility two-component system response regulator PilG
VAECLNLGIKFALLSVFDLKMTSSGKVLDRVASLRLNNVFAPSFARAQRHRCSSTASVVDVFGRCVGSAGGVASWVGGRRVEETKNIGDLTGLRVMVIDDSKTIRRTAEMLLKKEGCDVITAVDGFEALAKISDHQPRIIFVDIMMPRLDGYQTCALIKNNQTYKTTPVIMLSSKDGLFDKARGRIVGSEEYLTKPFTREELLGAIRRHVGRK